MPNLGNRIKERRIVLGYSQDTLASLTGFKTRSSIAKIESEKNDIPSKKLYDFAKALNCTVSDLLKQEDSGQ
jgi:repressor LexA